MTSSDERAFSYFAIRCSSRFSSKVPGNIQVSDFRFVLLAIAIDPAVTLLEPIGIVRQIKMDQMKAKPVQIEAFCQRVGTDQDQTRRIRRSAARRWRGPVVVLSADRQHLTLDSLRRPQGPGGGDLAIGILGVDQDIGALMAQSDQPHLQNDRR